MVLHLVVVVLFQQTTNCALHIPGKLVPHVVSFLRNHLDNDLYVKISVFEQLIIEKHKDSPEKMKDDIGTASTAEEHRAPDEKERVPGEIAHKTESRAVKANGNGKLNQEMQNLLDDLKQIVIRPKKP